MGEKAEQNARRLTLELVEIEQENGVFTFKLAAEECYIFAI